MLNKSTNFIRRLNRENCYFLKPAFSNLVGTNGMKIIKNKKNFISLQLCQLGKKHRAMGCEYHYK